MLRFVAVFVVIACSSFAGSHSSHAFDATDGVIVSWPNSSAATKWRVVHAQMIEDAARLAACRVDPEACSVEHKRFDVIVERGRGREGHALLGEINRAINLAIRPMSDLQRFGTPDHWTAPLETLRAGVGDCEDYAILKLFALREVGISEDDLMLVIVRDSVARTDHAVLAVRLEQRWLVLDNRTLVMADLPSALHPKRYRVLAQFGRQSDAQDYVSVAAASDFLM